jgi:hypothetical protein
VRPRSSAEPPNSISTVASWIISPAPAADDMHAEHAIGLGIGQDLHEAIGLLVGLGAAVRRERELADLVGDAGGLQLLLGLADGGDFRLRVDDARNDVVVHVAGLAGEDFGNRDALVLGLVREHRADAITSPIA